MACPFPQRLRRARRRKLLSQAQLGERLGYRARARGSDVVSRWETGGTQGPGPAELARLARELGVSADWLIGLDDNAPQGRVK